MVEVRGIANDLRTSLDYRRIVDSLRTLLRTTNRLTAMSGFDNRWGEPPVSPLSSGIFSRPRSPTESVSSVGTTRHVPVERDPPIRPSNSYGADDPPSLGNVPRHTEPVRDASTAPATTGGSYRRNSTTTFANMRNAPKFQTPDFDPRDDDPEQWLKYFENECELYGFDKKLMKTLLGKAILKAAENDGPAKTFWRNTVMDCLDYSELRKEFIAYYEDDVRLDIDQERVLAEISQSTLTAKQYKVYFDSTLHKATRVRRATGLPKYDDKVVLRYFLDGITDDTARATVWSARPDNWMEAAFTLEAYEKQIPRRRRDMMQGLRLDALRSRRAQRDQDYVPRIPDADDQFYRRNRVDRVIDHDQRLMELEQREEELERRYQEFVMAQKGAVENTPYEINPVVNAQKGKAARATSDRIENSLNDKVDDLVDRFTKLEIYLGKNAKENIVPNPTDERRPSYQQRTGESRYPPKRDISTVRCFKCGELGHYASYCQSERRVDVAHVAQLERDRNTNNWRSEERSRRDFR